jgi:hypothetical protein
MDQNTKDLLTILIPTLGPVLTALIPVLGEIIKERGRAVKSDGSDEAAKSALSPPLLVSPRRTLPFFRSPVFLSGMGGLVISLGVVFILNNFPGEPPAAAPPKIKVETVGTFNFNSPQDLPPILSVTEREVLTEGTTQFVSGLDRYVWALVCKEGEEKCSIQEITVYSSQEWDQRVKIGRQEDACTKFQVGFVIVERETNDILIKNLNTIGDPQVLRDMDGALDADWVPTLIQRECSNDSP